MPTGDPDGGQNERGERACRTCRGGPAGDICSAVDSSSNADIEADTVGGSSNGKAAADVGCG